MLQVHFHKERSQAKVVEKCQYTSALTIETVFRTIVSVNQLTIYGAASDLREECRTCHVRTGRPVVAGQSDPFTLFVPSVMKTHTHL